MGTCKPTHHLPLSVTEQQGVSVGDKRRVTSLGPGKGRCIRHGNKGDSNHKCGGQRTEDGGGEVACVGCEHIVGDKKSKTKAGKHRGTAVWTRLD